MPPFRMLISSKDPINKMPPSHVPISLKSVSISNSAEIRKLILDVDNKVLTKEKIKLVFERLGAQFPGYRAHRALWLLDDDGDGCIRMEDIDKLVRHIEELGYTVVK